MYGFRATLWEEHWGTWKPCFEKPESPECVREIQNLSRVNWEHYVQPDIVKLPGHAMPYPIKVLPRMLWPALKESRSTDTSNKYQTRHRVARADFACSTAMRPTELSLLCGPSAS